MIRRSFSFFAAIALLASAILALMGILGNAKSLALAGAVGIAGMLACSTLLILAAAASLSRGLGWMARAGGVAAIVLGLLSLFVAAAPFQSMGTVSLFTLVGLAFLGAGVLAPAGARRSPDQGGEHRPDLGRLGPAGVGVGTLLLMVNLANRSYEHGESKYQSYRASVRADLRNLAVAEENILADSGHYTSAPGPEAFNRSAGVIGPVITLTGDGWIARARHVEWTSECVIFIGSTPAPPATSAGETACTKDATDRKWEADITTNLVICIGLAAVGVWLAGRRAS